MITISSLVNVLCKLYNPPVRGLTSKRRRQHRKAVKNLDRTFRGQMRKPKASWMALAEKQNEGCWATPLVSYRFGETEKTE